MTSPGPMFTTNTLQSFIADIEDAVRATDQQTARVDRVATVLRNYLQSTHWLPEKFQKVQAAHYARHLVHRSSDLGVTVVAMVWAPGQTTPIHDHAGTWCVEGVYAGRILVTRYDLASQEGSSVFHFRQHGQFEQGLGGTGALIPPVEYHSIENREATPAVTVHVYGRELEQCGVYLPEPDGSHRLEHKNLQYATMY